MRHPLRLISITVAAVLAGSGSLLLGDGEVAAEPSAADPVAFTVDDAQLRWGVNNESNNAAFAPGTINFFSAGQVPDPGRGGTTLAEKDWRASEEQVRVEKRNPQGGYDLATWAGLRTTPDGTRLGSPTSGLFSDHQVVLAAGRGEVDPAAGTATIDWSGSFTILFYSGMSYVTVTDPQLRITPETARLTATLGGFGSDMNDPTKWVELADTRVTLANLPREDLVLPEEGGFSATPRYAGVAYTAPPGGVPQVGGPDKGAFPKTFVDFMGKVGSAAYWYSSGGATDRFKPALPLTVSYAAGEPVPVEPTETATPQPTPTQSVGPTAPPSSIAPSQPAAPTQPAQPIQPAQPAVVQPTAPAVSTGPEPAAIPPGLQAAPAVYALTASEPVPPQNSDHRVQWWLGTLLLLGAAVMSMFARLVKGTP